MTLNDLVSLLSTEDLNNDAIRYVLTGNASAFHDKFTFDVMDAKPNTLRDVFHIQWSVIEFEQKDFNVSESAEVIKVPLRRYGNLKQVSFCCGIFWPRIIKVIM